MAAVVVATEAFVFAKLLGPDSYGHYALNGQLVGLILILTTPSAAGYLYAYYRDSRYTLDRYYIGGSIVHYVMAAVAALAILLAIRPHLAVSVAVFAIQALYFVIEPMLRVRNHFAISAVGKAAGSAGALISLVIWLVVSIVGMGRLQQPDLTIALLLMIMGNLGGFTIYYLLVLRAGYLSASIGPQWYSPRNGILIGYGRYVLRMGLPLAIPGIMWLGFTFIDRLFIEWYRPATVLSTYALAWQLSQSALVCLSALNLVSAVRIGEHLSGEPDRLRNRMRRELLRTALVAVLLFMGLMMAAVGLRFTLYTSYSDLAVVTATVSIGYISQAVVASITPYLFYGANYRAMIFGYGSVFLASLAGNVTAIIFELSYAVPLVVTSCALVCMSVGLAIFTWREAQGRGTAQTTPGDLDKSGHNDERKFLASKP
jgi:O-antigen/teichoic acid export membrane protein